MAFLLIVLPCDAMPVFKQTIQLTFNHGSQQPFAQPSKWQLILNMVFQVAGIRPVGLEYVRMHPIPERTAHLGIAKLSSFDIPIVRRDPPHASRWITDDQLPTRTIANASRL